MKKNKSIDVIGPVQEGFDHILTEDALTFLAALARQFRSQVEALLDARDTRQERIDAGERPDFLESSREIRNGNWTVCKIPADLRDRRVEIIGPTDRKMIIKALNSGAKVFAADFEDSLSPSWENIVRGQINLRDAVNRSISLDVNGKHYELQDEIATLIVRPRGWHLPEKNLLMEGSPIPGALVDFGLYLFHNASELDDHGTGPYFYLPKLEGHEEARLWANVFRFAEQSGVVIRDRIRVTVLIETILAAFEMEEILYELRDYVVGLNCGRWNYIFSFVKKFHSFPEFVLPDRAEVTMNTHFLRSCSQLAIKTCHRRRVYAIGGIAAQTPVCDDPDENQRALARIRVDKEREADRGYDGTWVADPELVPIAMEIFGRAIPDNNQIDQLCEDVEITADDLLQVPRGKITEEGVRENIRVAIQYMVAWLDGSGCVPMNDMMADVATAEVSRAQLWQWTRHATGILDEGSNISPALFRRLLGEEVESIRSDVGNTNFDRGHYRQAAKCLDTLTLDSDFEPFLTTVVYDYLD